VPEPDLSRLDVDPGQIKEPRLFDLIRGCPAARPLRVRLPWV